ncbi:MAG: DUF1571 domain-containing protein [Phycisphaerae bacterium]|nr:DUF1571 domain-containing protein [Phycisphaerae bacterium]
MLLRYTFRPTNRRIRILVGLLLAGLFCLQCTQTIAFRQSRYMVAINGREIGANAPEVTDQLVELAKTDHIALLEHCLTHYRRQYHDYDCTLIKQERINGSVTPEQWIDVAFMGSPFSVAMQWVRNAPAGDRVLYVEGKHNGRMLIRPTSPLLRAVVPTAFYKPDSKEALRNSLRPVSMFGFERGLQSLLKVYRLARDGGDLREEFGGFAEVMGRNAIVIIRHLPNKPEYPAGKTVICIDLDHMVPICIEGYDWNQQVSWEQRLTGRYVYKDIRFNVGHTLDDFEPANYGLKSPS